MIAVITGATAGVGRATSVLFAKNGYDIGLIARDIKRLEQTKKEVESYGVKALTIPADVADAAALDKAAVKVEQELGAIDVWINNAMTSVFSPVKEMKPGEYLRVTEVVYLGAVYGTLAALKRMLPRDRGVIIQVGSALAYRAIPLQSAYSASKHALQGFTESLRSELLHDKSAVRVTMVQLPALNTPQFDWVKSRLSHRAQPVPPIYQPEMAAQAILWSVDHVRRELNVGIRIDAILLLNKFIPGLIEKYLASRGYSDQQTSRKEKPHRKDNLYHPVPGDFGAHGRFDNRAKNGQADLWFDTHLGLKPVISGFFIIILIFYLWRAVKF